MVWFSTPKSLENNTVSFLAIVEIILAIGIYWGIAVYFDVYWHIVSSIAFAPLLLLRSKESNDLSLQKFLKLISKRDGAIYNEKPFIQETELRGRVIGITFLFIFLLIVVVFGKELSFLNLLILAFVSGLGEIYFPIIYAILCKIYAIIKTFKYGYKQISSNWFINNFVTDFNQVPELIKGIEQEKSLNNYQISSIFKQLLKSSLFDKIFIFLIFLIMYSVTFFYRLSIKSTFWFYIPLLFVIKKPNLETSKQIGKFLSELYETTWVKVRGFLALLTLGAFFLTHFNYFSFESINSPFASILSLIYLDFSSLEMWKIFQLLVAIITIGLFFYANAIRVPNISNNIPLQKDIHIKVIYYLNSIRNWFSLFYLLSAFIFLAVHLKIWEYKYTPDFLNSFFTTLLEYIRYVPFN